MRRHTSSEKFQMLILRDDGSILAESTRRMLWGLPVHARKFVLQAKGDSSAQWVRVYGMLLFLESDGQPEHAANVLDLDSVPVDSRPDFVRIPAVGDDFWTFPYSWGTPIKLHARYFAKPSETPHVYYDLNGMKLLIERVNLQTGAHTPASSLPHRLVANWYGTQALADGSGLLVIQDGDTWYYDYTSQQAKIARLRTSKDRFLHAGWQRALYDTHDGFVVRELHTGFEISRVRTTFDQREMAWAMVPGMERLLATNTDHSVTLWDLNNGRELQTWNWRVGKPLALAVAPSGLMAAVAGTNRHVVIWDLDA